MPLYTYQIVTPTGDGPVIEFLQALGAPQLERHPGTGQPLRKLIATPNLPLRHGEAVTRDKLSDTNLARHGFTKYVRTGRGQFERTVGDSGPSHPAPG